MEDWASGAAVNGRGAVCYMRQVGGNAPGGCAHIEGKKLGPLPMMYVLPLRESHCRDYWADEGGAATMLPRQQGELQAREGGKRFGTAREEEIKKS